MQRFHQQVGTYLRIPPAQLFSSLFLPDPRLPHRVNRARVHPGVHLHDGDARDRVSREDRRLHRRGSAPARPSARRATAASSFSVEGWKTWILSDFARAATGGSVTSPFRPTGFPGWETTSGTRWPASRSASSAGREKDGDPKKTTCTATVYRHETPFSL